jgi:hypothetical protein
MKTVIHKYEIDGEQYEAIVERVTRREFVEHAEETIDGIVECGDEDSSVFVEYKDGRWYHSDDGRDGWRRTGIAWGVIDDCGATWKVFGDYELDENGIPFPREA